MNNIEVGLSFLEGLALIASPCILPVLPLVLGASVDSGRKRPFGIIVGFVLAFTIFAMFSRKLVALLGIDLELIKYASLFFLAFFGIILISEALSSKFSAFTQRFANAGNALTSNAKDGFVSGIFIGMMIGLIWTPCAGPIIAAVLVQIIRQESDLQALFLVASFAIGAGIPMLAIALTGRKLMSKISFLSTHAETIRKSFGVLILLSVAYIASGADIQSAFKREPVATTITATGLLDPLKNPYQAPEFTGLDGWLNSTPLTMADLKGKVVLIDFWTYSCINCIRTLPYVTAWDRTYRDKGLVIIGVHAPEFEFEKDPANIQKALLAHNIEYPIAIDNKLDTWTAYKNRYWPAHYLIDQNGRVVYTHFGEGNYSETENNIRFLLGLGAKNITDPAEPEAKIRLTPETYLGSARSKNFSKTYEQLLPNQWSLQGDWKFESQRIVSTKDLAKLKLHFTAKRVFLVLGTKDGTPVKATIALNGKPVGLNAGKDVTDNTITIDQHKLYELINQDQLKSGLLEVTAQTKGLEAYAFTFGRE